MEGGEWEKHQNVEGQVATSSVTYQIQTPMNTFDIETRVEALIDKVTILWKKEVVAAVFREDEAKLIQSIPLSSKGSCDRRIWEASARGIFSVKSANFLETLLQKRSTGDTSSSGSANGLWKKIWCLNVPGKVKMLLWKCFNIILPTRDNLFRKNIVEVTTMEQVDLAMYNEILTKNSERTAGRQTNESSQPWKPPMWPNYKVNFDAAFDQASGRMGIGVVIRDSEGEVLGCLTTPKEHVSSVFQAESYDLHRAMEL
ncbi:hypothetical protein CIPAW_10G104200 [Carya illinoinensis]|uniref:RNase H type-1 domain-containing protein n=1 Tax=Carya illinoinensis TaxID=32201 RepID=A0A8T1P4M3_CARIL|nr:hypothetical protein CIPAW_10G104200 [Carya illinoinensis]